MGLNREEIKNDIEYGYVKGTCTRPPQGWGCTREENHSGPCAAYATAKSVKVDVSFTCGHTYTYSSPGVSDPAGLYRLLAKDGLVESSYKCFLCEGGK